MQFELLNESIYDAETLYVFRDKKTKLYVGYDGYDTDFSRGMSAFIPQDDLILELNKKLISKSESEIRQLLERSMFDKEWKSLGGWDNLEIVRLELESQGTVFNDPIDLIHCFRVEDAMDEDTDMTLGIDPDADGSG